MGYTGGNLPRDTVCGVYTPAKDWTSLATWTTYDEGKSWDKAGGDFFTTPLTTIRITATPVNAWFEFNVTNAVKEYVKNPSLYKGFIIAIPGGDDVLLTGSLDNNNEMASSEATDTPDLTPRLEVTYTTIGISQNSVARIKSLQSLSVQRGTITATFSRIQHRSVSLFSANGQLVSSVIGARSIYSLSVETAGVYFMRIAGTAEEQVLRIVSQ